MRTRTNAVSFSKLNAFCHQQFSRAECLASPCMPLCQCLCVCLRALFCFCVLCSKEFAPLCFSMLMHSAKNLCICMCGCICVFLLLCQPFSLYVCHSSYLSASSCLCLSLSVSRLLYMPIYFYLYINLSACIEIRDTNQYDTIRYIWYEM